MQGHLRTRADNLSSLARRLRRHRLLRAHRGQAAHQSRRGEGARHHPHRVQLRRPEEAALQRGHHNRRDTHFLSSIALRVGDLYKQIRVYILIASSYNTAWIHQHLVFQTANKGTIFRRACRYNYSLQVSVTKGHTRTFVPRNKHTPFASIVHGLWLLCWYHNNSVPNHTRSFQSHPSTKSLRRSLQRLC